MSEIGQTGINTANEQWAKAMGLNNQNSSDIWKIGAVNSANYFFAAGTIVVNLAGPLGR